MVSATCSSELLALSVSAHDVTQLRAFTTRNWRVHRASSSRARNKKLASQRTNHNSACVARTKKTPLLIMHGYGAEELARRGAARQRHTMMARREAPLGPRAFFKRPRSLPTTGAEQRASERRGPSCGLFARATGASFARNLTSSPRKGPCSRTAPVRLHPGLSVRETEAC